MRKNLVELLMRKRFRREKRAASPLLLVVSVAMLSGLIGCTVYDYGPGDRKSVV